MHRFQKREVGSVLNTKEIRKRLSLTEEKLYDMGFRKESSPMKCLRRLAVQNVVLIFSAHMATKISKSLSLSLSLSHTHTHTHGRTRAHAHTQNQSCTTTLSFSLGRKRPVFHTIFKIQWISGFGTRVFSDECGLHGNLNIHSKIFWRCECFHEVYLRYLKFSVWCALSERQITGSAF
jgi:hypothetical protein